MSVVRRKNFSFSHNTTGFALCQLFLRGMPHLHIKMRRLKSHDSKAPTPDQAPNFSRMPVPDKSTNIALNAEGSNGNGGVIIQQSSAIQGINSNYLPGVAQSHFANLRSHPEGGSILMVPTCESGIASQNQHGHSHSVASQAQTCSIFNNQAYATYANQVSQPNTRHFCAQNLQQNVPSINTAAEISSTPSQIGVFLFQVQPIPNHMNQLMMNQFMLQTANQHQCQAMMQSAYAPSHVDPSQQMQRLIDQSTQHSRAYGDAFPNLTNEQVVINNSRIPAVNYSVNIQDENQACTIAQPFAPFGQPSPSGVAAQVPQPMTAEEWLRGGSNDMRPTREESSGRQENS